MSRTSAEEIRYGLKNGSREVLFYLARRYFQTSRRWLRTKGFRDVDTPMIFSDALVRLMRESQHKQFPGNMDVRELFSNVLRNYVRELKQQALGGEKEDDSVDRSEVIARCFTIMDGSLQQVLSGRYADRLTCEELASRYGYGNAVIAEAELDKAFFSLEQVVDARLSASVHPDVPLSGPDARTADRYLEGALTGSELVDFENRLQRQDGLNARIAFRRAVIQGIRQASDDLLAQEVAASIGYRKSVLPFGLKLLLGFAFVVLLVLLGWNYLGSDAASDRAVISFRWLNKVGSIIQLNKGQRAGSESVSKKNEEEPAAGQESESATDTMEEARISGMEDSLTNGTETDLVESDIIVRKDILLMTVQIKPVELELRDAEKPSPSIADAAVRTLHPSAGLPLAEEQEIRLDVELWSSPVNYRGYRRSGNSVSLYGFESTEGLGFYRLIERIFVRSGNELYELFPADNYQSYQPVRDQDLLERCR